MPGARVVGGVQGGLALLSADLDPTEFKVHRAVQDGDAHPIEVLADDPGEWKRWNSWEIVGRRPEPRTYSYDVVFREDLMGPLSGGFTCA